MCESRDREMIPTKSFGCLYMFCIGTECSEQATLFDVYNNQPCRNRDENIYVKMGEWNKCAIQCYLTFKQLTPSCNFIPTLDDDSHNMFCIGQNVVNKLRFLIYTTISLVGIETRTYT